MIVACVTIEDETMTVRHDDVQSAIDALAPADAGGRIELVIEYREMTDDKFAALREYQ